MTSVLAAFTFIVDIIAISADYKPKLYTSTANRNIAAIVLLIFSGVMFLILFLFGIYHIILASRGVIINIIFNKII